MKDGDLVIQGLRGPATCTDGSTQDFISGGIESKGKVAFGPGTRLEIVAQMPALPSDGSLPAFSAAPRGPDAPAAERRQVRRDRRHRGEGDERPGRAPGPRGAALRLQEFPDLPVRRDEPPAPGRRLAAVRGLPHLRGGVGRHPDAVVCRRGALLDGRPDRAAPTCPPRAPTAKRVEIDWFTSTFQRKFFLRINLALGGEGQAADGRHPVPDDVRHRRGQRLQEGRRSARRQPVRPAATNPGSRRCSYRRRSCRRRCPRRTCRRRPSATSSRRAGPRARVSSPGAERAGSGARAVPGRRVQPGERGCSANHALASFAYESGRSDRFPCRSAGR